MKSESVKQIAKYAALVLLGMFLSALLLGGSIPGWFAAAQGAQPAETVASPGFNEPAPQGEVWTTCTPENIASYTTRVHVKCVESVGGIRYFAVSTNNAAHAARILSVLETAKASGRTLSILYETSDQGLPTGCLATDCRTLNAASMW